MTNKGMSAETKEPSSKTSVYVVTRLGGGKISNGSEFTMDHPEATYQAKDLIELSPQLAEVYLMKGFITDAN